MCDCVVVFDDGDLFLLDEMRWMLMRRLIRVCSISLLDLYFQNREQIHEKIHTN